MDFETFPADLLSELETALQAAPNAIAELPARRYIHVGEIVDDCNQLVISFQGTAPGTPDTDSRGVLIHSNTRTAQYEVRWSFCVPSGTRQAPPTTDQLTDSAEEWLPKFDKFSKSLRAAVYNSNLGTKHGDVSIQNIEVVGPTGALAAFSARVNVHVV